MMAQNPNMRGVKPLSRYMDLRFRMVGRQRFALEHTVVGNNYTKVKLPFVPACAETLEIYVDGSRVVGGYTVAKDEVTFTTPKNGTILFISDNVVVDKSQKWLVIPTDNLIMANNPAQTSYGTDRRPEHMVATFTKPIVITQGAMGFCRPNEDNTKLLYSSYYGMFGRDSVTYALVTDAGQLSDYRCLDIRIRDPNFVPVIRLVAVAAEPKPLKFNGVVVSPTETGPWQTYGEALSGGIVELPNVKEFDNLNEYHFVLQGKDEEGKWFEFSDFFDEGEYEIIVDHSGDPEDMVVTKLGESPEEFGFTNGNRVSLMCRQRTESYVNIRVRFTGHDIFTAQVQGRAPKKLGNMDVLREISGATFTYIDDPAAMGPVTWEAGDEQVGPYGMTSRTTFANTRFETHPVRLEFKGLLTFEKAFYDPNTQTTTQTEFDISYNAEGTFTTDEDPEKNSVVISDHEMPLLGTRLLWDSSDIFSPMSVYDPLVFTYTFNWSIQLNG